MWNSNISVFPILDFNEPFLAQKTSSIILTFIKHSLFEQVGTTLISFYQTSIRIVHVSPTWSPTEPLSRV